MADVEDAVQSDAAMEQVLGSADLLGRILGALSVSQLLKVAGVSRHWREVSSSDQLWRPLWKIYAKGSLAALKPPPSSFRSAVRQLHSVEKGENDYSMSSFEMGDHTLIADIFVVPEDKKHLMFYEASPSGAPLLFSGSCSLAPLSEKGEARALGITNTMPPLSAADAEVDGELYLRLRILRSDGAMLQYAEPRPPDSDSDSDDDDDEDDGGPVPTWCSGSTMGDKCMGVPALCAKPTRDLSGGYGYGIQTGQFFWYAKLRDLEPEEGDETQPMQLVIAWGQRFNVAGYDNGEEWEGESFNAKEFLASLSGSIVPPSRAGCCWVMP